MYYRPFGPNENASQRCRTGRYQDVGGHFRRDQTQREQLRVSVNGGETEAKVTSPYTAGKWQDTDPVTIDLKKGANTLLFTRSNPDSPQPHPDGGPDTLHFQRGMAIKSLTLKPVR